MGRWIGLAKPAAIERDVFEQGLKGQLAPQLKEILATQRQMQDHLARLLQSHDEVTRAGNSPASTQETDRLVLALLKMAQVGGLGGHVFDHAGQASILQSPERRRKSAASSGAGSIQPS